MVGRDERSGELLYVARSLVGFLYQVSSVTNEVVGSQERWREKDRDIVQLKR